MTHWTPAPPVLSRTLRDEDTATPSPHPPGVAPAEDSAWSDPPPDTRTPQAGVRGVNADPPLPSAMPPAPTVAPRGTPQEIKGYRGPVQTSVTSVSLTGMGLEEKVGWGGNQRRGQSAPPPQNLCPQAPPNDCAQGGVTQRLGGPRMGKLRHEKGRDPVEGGCKVCVWGCSHDPKPSHEELSQHPIY